MNRSSVAAGVPPAIGVGMARFGPPLPPNRTGGFPASGSPVDESPVRPYGIDTGLVHLARVEAFREINPSSVKKALGYRL